MLGIIGLRTYLIIAAVIAVFFSGWEVNGMRWQAKYSALDNTYKEAIIKADQEAKAKELALNNMLDSQKKVKDDQIALINHQLSNALIELRSRPVRSSNPSDFATLGKGATGRSLFAEDAGFLIGEAARADKLRTELQSCYATYDSARQIINAEK